MSHQSLQHGTRLRVKSNRELLEKAASAAGYRVVRSEAEMHGCTDDSTLYGGVMLEGIQKAWDPSSDDGDCARLEAACKLNVEWQEQHVIVGSTKLDQWREPYMLHDGDKQAARRFAAVRAAAAQASMANTSQEASV